MSSALRKFEKQAKSLTAEERAQLAEVLLESLRAEPLAEIEAAWDREIEARARCGRSVEEDVSEPGELWD